MAASSVLLAGLLAQEHSVDVPTFHGDAQRTGWYAGETQLTPATVGGGDFGLLWSTEPLDAYDDQPAHLYASPLYVDHAAITSDGRRADLGVAIVATSNDYVYAINVAASPGLAAGAILWRSCLGKPGGRIDGGVPIGVLSTPTIDLTTKRIYVVSNNGGKGWQASALGLEDGKLLPGWPVSLDDQAVSAPGINRNGPSRLPAAGGVSQRGALNLSADGTLLYVVFGGYTDGTPGWILALDTAEKKVVAAFSGAPSPEPCNAGIWASGGPSLDAQGNVFAVTGNGPRGVLDRPGSWGQSLLKWSQPREGFKLAGTYTPFNYEAADNHDIDLGACAPVIIPDLDPHSTATPRLLTFGGKQGNVYLLDRDHLPGLVDRRPPPSNDPTSDRSLLPPGPQPQFGARGPLNVFGPYTELFGNNDQARSRSTPAYFRGPDGSHYLVVTGTTKTSVEARDNAPPCLARLKIVTSAGQPAYLAIDALEKTLTFRNPGCAVVSSNGARDAVIWVLDSSVRTAALNSAKTPRPTLYAVDALTLTPLWHSAPEQFGLGGRYNAPTVARGLTLVVADRLYAFGLKHAVSSR